MMSMMSRGLKAGLLAALLWPLTGLAALTVTSSFSDWTWSNSAGDFVMGGESSVAPYAAGFVMTSTQNSYSTASSLFSYESSNAFFRNSTTVFNLAGKADVQIDAIVEGNGTSSGNLVGGILTVHAGPLGISELGAAAGDLLMTGYAIDSAASKEVGTIAFLFGITYEVPQLSGFGDYVTFIGSLNNAGTCFAPCSVVTPWGLDFSNIGNTSFDSLVPTRKVAEPATLALLGLGLAGLGFSRRKA